MARHRASIPKHQVHNNAIYAAMSPDTFESVRNNPARWGRCVESAVGAYLISQAFREQFEVLYWRDGSDEVEFVLQIKGQLSAIEIKSNFEKHSCQVA